MQWNPGNGDGVRSPVFRCATDLVVQNAEGGSVERFDMRRIALTGTALRTYDS